MAGDRQVGVVGEPFGQPQNVLARVPVGPIEAEQGRRHFGDVSDQLAQRLPADLVAAQHGIGEQLAQLGQEARLLGPGEGLHIDVVGLGQLEQQRTRERPPVVLDQVQIAGRYAEAGGHLDLGHPPALAQTA